MVKLFGIIATIKQIPALLKEIPGVLTILKKVWNIIKGWYYKLFNKKQSIAEERLKICNQCDNRTKSALGDTCSLCGCVLDAKTRVKDEYCDIDKW